MSPPAHRVASSPRSNHIALRAKRTSASSAFANDGRDRCEYRGVWYVCGGAASGSWWQGSEFGFTPCYGAIDLYPGGGFEYRFVDYGWKARAWRGEELKV